MRWRSCSRSCRSIAGVYEVFLDYDLNERFAVFARWFWRLLFGLFFGFGGFFGLVLAGLAFLLRHFELLEQLGDFIHRHRV